MQNAFKIDLGVFQTDKNRTFFGQVSQVFGRLSWELPQTDIGNMYTHFQNITGNIDRVDYFGGATFATNENSKKTNGITFGSYININIKDRIKGNFEDRVLSDPLFMHEYGHTIDSQYFGPLYLFAIAIPSGISAWQSVNRKDNAHDHYWTEIRANNKASRYFKKHYGIDWTPFKNKYPTD
ncbi:hypothetical protein IRZ80_16255 [Flavobacterium sp. HJJ]|nr:hypothetical protein [Flavobacterium sp. HJJ]